MKDGGSWGKIPEGGGTSSVCTHTPEKGEEGGHCQQSLLVHGEVVERANRALGQLRVVNVVARTRPGPG